MPKARARHVSHSVNRYYFDPFQLLKPTTSDEVFVYRDFEIRQLQLHVTTTRRFWKFVSSGFERTIGNAQRVSLSEARQTALKWMQSLNTDGQIPPTAKERRAFLVCQTLTVAQMFDKYFEGHLKHNARTAQEIKTDIERYWSPINRLVASSLTSANVRAWLNGIAGSERKFATANKQLTILKASLKWCQDNGHMPPDSNRFADIKAFSTSPTVSYLKKDEVPRLIEALQEESQILKDLVFMLILTGQRLGNVLSMSWAEIDWHSKTWQIPPAKTKTNQNYCIGLSDAALAILESRRGNQSLFVFPTERRSSLSHINNITHAWHRIRARAGLEHLCLHSLRHTAATWAALDGASATTIQQIMQHKSFRTSERYVHLNADVARAALNSSQSSAFNIAR